MVNEELVKQLLKQLENEYKSPIQLRADTPQTEYNNKGKIYFGNFVDRAVIVKKVDNLDQKYLGDVELLESLKYNSFTKLKNNVSKLNVLYNHPANGTVTDRAWNLVKEKTGIKLFMGNSIAINFEMKPKMLSRETVYEILDNEGIKYFKHNILVFLSGIYDDRTPYGGTINIIDRTKIADISFKLIE